MLRHQREACPLAPGSKRAASTVAPVASAEKSAPLTAADIIKRAMIAVDRWLLAAPEAARMIMQVHDELVFEVPEDTVDAVAAEVRLHMEGAAALRVPLKVDVGVGANWDEAH